MRRSRSHVVLALVAVLAGLVLGALGGVVGPASAHEERPAGFPDGSGERPSYLGLDNPRHRVVCRPDSDERIAQLPGGPLKARNMRLLQECRFGSIQTAINSIKRRNTSIYVLPGYYTERRWARAERSASAAGAAVRRPRSSWSAAPAPAGSPPPPGVLARPEA